MGVDPILFFEESEKINNKQKIELNDEMIIKRG